VTDGPAAPDAPSASRSPRRTGRLPPPRRRVELVGLLAVASLLLLVSLLVPGTLAGTLFALLGVAFPVGLIALGAVRRGRLDRRVVLALVLLLAVLEGSTIAIMALSGSGAPRAPGPVGLPEATVVQLVGLWLLPLPLVALAYAWTFDRSGVGRDDLAALRRARAKAPEGPRASPGPLRPTSPAGDPPPPDGAP